MGLAAPAAAQVFLASRPHPDFSIGPLIVQASLTPALGPTVVDVLWSVVVAPEAIPADLEQDLYLLWPSGLTRSPAGEPSTSSTGQADPALGRYVEARGFTVIDEGRLPLFAQELYRMDSATAPVAMPGGAPFVTYVRQSGPAGLTPPATFIRIPWTPRLVDRAWLMSLRLTTGALLKRKKGTFVENAFWGDRHLVSLSFHDVNHRALFPMYLEHRDRVVRLAEDPAQLVANFASAERLKIEEVTPPTSRRQLSETLEDTEVVSRYIDRSEGLSPQVLTVQFAYFSGLRAWAPVLIPILFFALGNLAGPIIRFVAARIARAVAARFQFASPLAAEPYRDEGVVLSRATIDRIVPGETTYAELLRLAGAEAEEHEDLSAPHRRTLVYRGRRIVPHRRRIIGWLARVTRWDVEHHEVEIQLEGDVVRDVQARVRRAHLVEPQPA